MCGETRILSGHHLKAINGMGQNPHILGENDSFHLFLWNHDGKPCSRMWGISKGGQLRNDMTTVAVAQEKLWLYFYYKGTAWSRGGKNPLSATLQCMWQTGLIPTCQHPFQTPPRSQKSISKRRQLSVATSQRNPPVTRPPSPATAKATSEEKKIWVKFCQKEKGKKSPRKNNLWNTISRFQNLYQCQIII